MNAQIPPLQFTLAAQPHLQVSPTALGKISKKEYFDKGCKRCTGITRLCSKPPLARVTVAEISYRPFRKSEESAKILVIRK